MKLVHEALRAGHKAQRTAPAQARAVLLAAGGGALGAEVVERLLGHGGFWPGQVLATPAFQATAPGLEPVAPDALQAAPPLALVVFDRERHANGRDAAFVRPLPEQLPALAQRLHGAGVRRLVIVMPHASALMPEALRAGLASLDEQAVAALGFEHLSILRSARPPAAIDSRGLQRVADMVLAQLRMMTPQHQQPLRARKVAQIAVEVARQLEGAPPGTRVLAPERVWQAAQLRDPRAFVRGWLAGEALPELTLRVGRM